MKTFLGIECRCLLAAALTAALSLTGCGGSNGTAHSSSAGATGAAGNAGGGGASAISSSHAGTSGGPAGTSGSAGARPAAGTIGPSGGAGAAGSSGVAGSVASAGNTGSPGGAGASGTSASGGSVTTTDTGVTGGAGNAGGTVISGGVPTGGTKASGGATPNAGTTVSGGTKQTGGITTAGGTTSTGGSTPKGGTTTATSGTTPTGGVATTSGGTRPYAGVPSTTGSGVPVLISSFTAIAPYVGTPGMRIGDINGDGKMEIVMGQPMVQPGAYTPQQVVCVTAWDLKGNKLWQYGTPGTSHGASSDIPIQVYDMDGDGKSEVFANMSDTEMTVLDGTTGKLLRTIPLPQAGSNDSIAFADLRGKGWPQDILVKTRYSQNWAIVGIDDNTTSPPTKAGTVLWHHQFLPSDSSGSDRGTGHFPLVYDWNKDGKDEVMAGYFFLQSDGTQVWTTNTTSHPELTMHADCLATADVDGDPSNGYEIVVGGNVAAMFHWKDGSQIWEDNNTVEDQQMGIGEYRSDSPGLEVVLLDRIGPRTAQGHDANVLLSSTDTLLWKESRTDYGWITVTENMNNWLGDGTDLILSYHRGGTTPPTLYDGYDKVVAQFPHSGNLVDNVQHANLCGDGKEEVIVYNETGVWIFANGDCNLDAAPAQPSIPQQYHLYNFSEYSGWITPDVKFYTPGSAH
jgi:FG-GAP-like repeat